MSDESFLRRLIAPGPLVTVELRPPRSGLEAAESMDVWIDMHHSLQALARAGRPVLITDNAVAVQEEENLAHLTANLPDGLSPKSIAPFLTCKHTLEYCLLYASRAASAGFGALTVLGGDRFGGPSVLHGIATKMTMKAGDDYRTARGVLEMTVVYLLRIGQGRWVDAAIACFNASLDEPLERSAIEAHFTQMMKDLPMIKRLARAQRLWATRVRRQRYEFFITNSFTGEIY